MDFGPTDDDNIDMFLEICYNTSETNKDSCEKLWDTFGFLCRFFFGFDMFDWAVDFDVALTVLQEFAVGYTENMSTNI